MTWSIRSSDDGEVHIAGFATQREAQDWINERTMPWNFYASEDGTMPTNIDDAVRYANRLGELSLVRATLIGILNRRPETELEGGWREALANHPLMQQIEAEKAVLEEQILLLI